MEIWDSGGVLTLYGVIFELLVFNVFWGSFGALVTNQNSL